MKESEKIELVNELLPLIDEGKSYEDIREIVEDKVKGSYTVNSVMTLLQRKNSIKYNASFKKAYGDKTIDRLRSELPFINDSVFDSLILEQKQELFKISQSKFIKLLDKGTRPEDAALEVVNDEYTQADAEADVASRGRVSKEKSENTSKFIGSFVLALIYVLYKIFLR